MNGRWNKKTLAAYIDHTSLKANVTPDQVRKLCHEAKESCFASVCINPFFVPLASGELLGTLVKVCTVVGFPSGAHDPKVKAEEARLAVASGAREIDMVLNIGAFKSGDIRTAEADIRAVIDAAGDASVKIFIETCFLTDEEKVAACRLAMSAGAEFVVTSTGFGTSGAKIEDILLMRKTVGNDLKIKAAGGIRTLEDALAMIDAGADRIGASTSLDIINALPK